MYDGLYVCSGVREKEKKRKKKHCMCVLEVKEKKKNTNETCVQIVHVFPGGLK